MESEVLVKMSANVRGYLVKEIFGFCLLVSPEKRKSVSGWLESSKFGGVRR